MNQTNDGLNVSPLRPKAATILTPDWRMTVNFVAEETGHRVLAHLDERASAALAESRLKTSLAVHREGTWLRIYAPGYDALVVAQEEIVAVIDDRSVIADILYEHFSDGDDVWRVIDSPPISEAYQREVRSHSPTPEWGAIAEPDRVQVRWEFQSRREAMSFARRLSEHGLEIYRHWTWVFVFAVDGAHARRIAAEFGTHESTPIIMGEGPKVIFI